MNTTNPNTTLFTHSWFTSKAYRLNNDDKNLSHLSVSKASMSEASSEKFPLDMIEEVPRLENKIDPSLITFGLICALASGVFFALASTQGLTILSLFSGLFFVASIVSFIVALENRIHSYTYLYRGSNTPMFTLTTKQADKEKVEQFVKDLNDSIKLATLDNEISNTTNPSQITVQSDKQAIKTEEQEYLAYTYHLDFLFASGLMDDESYLKVGQNISERVFGRKQASLKAKPEEKTGTSNIIHFPR